MSAKPFLLDEGFERLPPPMTPRTRPFWMSGEDGRLRIARCAACRRFQHPPMPICPACQSRELAFEPVSGRGRVFAWTLNRYAWQPSLPAPYVIAQVELVEQTGLRLLTNVVGCPSDRVHVGLEVEVCFARAGEAFVPLFRPVSA